MHREHYIYQKFLVENCDESFDIPFIDEKEINLSEIQNYGAERNLFDIDYFCRKVKLSYLDENIDSEGDLCAFAKSIKDIDCLYIEYDRKDVDNAIYKEFGKKILCGLIAKFAEYGIYCKVYQGNKRII